MVTSNASLSPDGFLPNVRKTIIRKVLDDLLVTESGAMALQHLGMLWLLYEFSDERMTTGWVKEQTNITSTAIIKLTKRLESLGLLKRGSVTARHGRGRSWEYTPVVPADIKEQAVRELLANVKPFGNSVSMADLLGDRPKAHHGTERLT